MSLILGQLIYTSFAKVGFQARASSEVPAEVCQKFVEQIVYPNWDYYSSPGDDYRAAYLYQITPDQTLFGWLYSDEADDFGRRHVPYFVCYYLAAPLQAAQLKSIFTWLLIGPIALLDRQHPPDTIKGVTFSSEFYQSERSGIGIFSSVQEQGYLSVQQGKLFRLFVSEDSAGQHLKLAASIDVPLLESPKLSRITQSSTDSASAQYAAIVAELLTRSKIEAYQQILLSRVQSHANQPEFLPTKNLAESSKLRRSLFGVAALIALLLSGFYLLRLFPSAIVQHASTQNTSSPIEPLTLEKTFSETAPVWTVVLSPDQQTVIGGGTNQTIKIWKIETGTVINTLSGHTDTVRSLVLTPDGRTLISASGDRTLKIWDLQTNQLIQTLTQASPVWTMAVSPDGKTLFSGGEDGVLKVWQLPTGELLQANSVHQGEIFAIVISPDGKTVATASVDRTIKLWNAQTGALLRTMVGHTDAVRALAFSPDGKTLASASWDKTLKLWNWQTGDLIRTFVGHTARVVNVVFSPDGQTLISGSGDRRINVWAVQDGTLLRSLSDHSDWVLSLATAPINSKRLISSSKDQTIRIWQFH